MLGIPLKEEKGHGPAAALDLLGLEVLLASTWVGLRLTDARREALAQAVSEAVRTRRLTRRDAARLGGQLGFANSALFGRFGRVYTNAVAAHEGGWSPQLDHALGAILQCPLYHTQKHGAGRPTAVAYADGSWCRRALSGAVGGVLFTTHAGNHCFSAVIPAQIRAELLTAAKQQRNTQSELFAVLTLLLTFADVLRGADVVLYEDNTAAKDNILSGAAGDADSQALVGAIWLLAAVLRISLQVEYIASESNPSDCFSRPDESPKQQEAHELTAAFSLSHAEARLPASLQMDAAVWASALSTSQEEWAHADRRARPLLLGPV